MGLIFSRFGRQRCMIDYGYTTPLGLYVDGGTDNYHSRKVRKGKRKSSDAKAIEDMILARKLSPFYKGSSTPHFHGNIDPYSQIVNCMSKESAILTDNMSKFPLLECQTKSATSIVNNIDTDKRRTLVSSISFIKNYKKKTRRSSMKYEIYREGIECPICLLYYPKNINYSVCCDQPICTECFVQIIRKRKSLLKQKKRTESQNSNFRCYTGASSAAPNTGLRQRHQSTSLNDNPEENLCPFCMTESFNVKYDPTTFLGDGGNRTKVTTAAGYNPPAPLSPAAIILNSTQLVKKQL